MLASSGDYFFPDSFTYLAPARFLLHGDGFLTEPGVAETIRTPVYPLLLIPFLSHVTAVVVLQHLLNALLAVAIYLFLIRRHGHRFVALAAALLFALDTPTIHYANKVLTECVFTAVLFAVLLLALDE